MHIDVNSSDVIPDVYLLRNIELIVFFTNLLLQCGVRFTYCKNTVFRGGMELAMFPVHYYGKGNFYMIDEPIEPLA
jgi:hypothetical protein